MAFKTSLFPQFSSPCSVKLHLKIFLMEGDGIPQKSVYDYVQEGRLKKLDLIEEKKPKERKKHIKG